MHPASTLFVTDTLPSVSRMQNETGEQVEQTRVFQELPVHAKRHHSNSESFYFLERKKESLTQFIVRHWKTLSSEDMCGKTLYATLSNNCLVMSADPNSTAILTSGVSELDCDHEEAKYETSKHASDLITNIVIKSRDTDVFLLYVASVSLLSCNLYFSIGSGKNSRLLHINPIMERFGQHVADAIAGLHAFTGCDSISSLKGKGKIKPFQLMLSAPMHIETFTQLGQKVLTPLQLQNLEAFVCKLYGQKKPSVDEARHNVFRLTCKSDHSLPPNSDCLALHSQRANYQAAIWWRCFTPTISAPSSDGSSTRMMTHTLHVWA